VLHVVAHEFENADDMAIVADAGMTIGSFVKQRDEALRRRLQEAVATAPEFCSVESLMTHGKPWREVLRIATERQSDLTGTVRWPHEKSEAESIVRQIDGVQRVFNNINVANVANAEGFEAPESAR
jgi:BON domain-containing protein